MLDVSKSGCLASIVDLLASQSLAGSSLKQANERRTPFNSFN
jgi:hypothetical protein